MFKKILEKLILCVFTTITVFSTNNYALNLSTIGLDKSLLSTYLADDESNNEEVMNAVIDFRYNYITQNMSDFEIEMQIIKYLVETVEYDTNESEIITPEINDKYMAYGALVNHKAVCSGYAKAFDIMAKSCGLSSTVATGQGFNETQNGPHAWNQIYLDGEWYNVDVTWEDPIINEKLGFNNLLNEYINRTDVEFSKDHSRETGNACYGTKYGKNTVANYLVTGIVDTNVNIDALRKNLLLQIKASHDAGKNDEVAALIDKLVMVGAKYDDNTNYFPDNDDSKITEYILSKYASGERVMAIVCSPNSSKNLSIDSGHWLESNLRVNTDVSLKIYFVGDGKVDTRVVLFN